MNLANVQDYPQNWIDVAIQIFERLDFLREAKEKNLNLLSEDIEHQEKMLNKHLNLLVAEVNLSHVKFKCHIDSFGKRDCTTGKTRSQDILIFFNKI